MDTPECSTEEKPVDILVFKQCSFCKQVLPLERFTPDCSKPGGFTYDCKQCRTRINEMRSRGDFSYRKKRIRKIVILVEKHCALCGEMLPLESFSPDKRSSDGRCTYCKPCCNKRDRERRIIDGGRIRKRHRGWSSGRRSILNTQHRERYKIRYPLIKDHINTQRRTRWHATPKVHRSRQREYRLRNPELMVAHTQLRRARLKNAPINDLTAAQWLAIKVLYRWRCVYCSKKTVALTQDHVVPLSKGGSHTMENIVPACRSCNSKKGTGSPLCPIQSIFPLKDLA